jgi:hypothetical protein
MSQSRLGVVVVVVRGGVYVRAGRICHETMEEGRNVMISWFLTWANK